MRSAFVIVSALISLASAQSRAQTPIGTWSGTLFKDGVTTPVMLDVQPGLTAIFRSTASDRYPAQDFAGAIPADTGQMSLAATLVKGQERTWSSPAKIDLSFQQNTASCKSAFVAINPSVSA